MSYTKRRVWIIGKSRRVKVFADKNKFPSSSVADKRSVEQGTSTNI